MQEVAGALGYAGFGMRRALVTGRALATAAELARGEVGWVVGA
jgi:hypothetical protein